MTGTRFRKPCWKRPFTIPPTTAEDRDGFLTLYKRHVARRFTRITRLPVVTFPFDLPAPAGAPVTPMPAHPECADHVGSTQCAREWEDHLRILRRRPGVHAHECPFGMHCAVVPVVWKKRCVAAAKLVCPPELSRTDFDHHVEILDLLTDNFLTGISRWLAPWVSAAKPPRRLPAAGTPSVNRRRLSARASEHVARAVEYIKQHYRNPCLKVEDVGPAVGLSGEYLGHLFAEVAGQRMHEYLADCRLRYARTLLAATNRPIKKVALQSGFLHYNWFGELFCDRFGLSPRAFRQSRPAAGEIPSRIS